MAVQERLYTARDLENMPDDGKIYELHDGVLIEVAGSKRRQAILAAWIVYLLTSFIQEHGIGGAVSGADGACTLDRYNTRIPDVSYMTAETLDKQPAEDSFLFGAPDLAVEVISPSNTRDEIMQRVGAYLRAGARLVWLVYPENRTVEVHRPDEDRLTLGEGTILDGYDRLPGLKLPLATLFSRL